ncbi:hypothetical protein [Burkholderia gladioli]|uniref:hypothetical protein n=1 Tax=Burkholderia gladioli TaxID=28095 RepID=UPI00164066F5|nr:hypothetical protein [Burkholderia gladioli]
MRITKRMNLTELARLIGTGATREDAAIVRAALVCEGFAGRDTNTLPETVWTRIAYQSPTA